MPVVGISVVVALVGVGAKAIRTIAEKGVAGWLSAPGTSPAELADVSLLAILLLAALVFPLWLAGERVRWWLFGKRLERETLANRRPALDRLARHLNTTDVTLLSALVLERSLDRWHVAEAIPWHTRWRVHRAFHKLRHMRLVAAAEHQWGDTTYTPTPTGSALAVFAATTDDVPRPKPELLSRLRTSELHAFLARRPGRR